MKSERNRPIKANVEKLVLSYGELHIRLCNDTNVITEAISDEDARKSFPPDGKLVSSELDTFFLILLDHTIVGFYRIIDLFFDGEIELHGSFFRHDTLLNRAYFMLTVRFVDSIMRQYADKTICTTIAKDNIAVRKFLDFLGFVAKEVPDDSSPYIRYVKKRSPNDDCKA